MSIATVPRRVFPCQTAAEVRATLPPHTDVVAFQCRNPVHRAHYELFTRSLDAPNVSPGAVCLVRARTDSCIVSNVHESCSLEDHCTDTPT